MTGIRSIFRVLVFVLAFPAFGAGCQDELLVASQQAAEVYDEILDLEEAFQERAQQVGIDLAADWLFEQYPELMLKIMSALEEQGVSFTREGLSLVIEPSQETLLGRVAEGLNNKLDARLVINFYDNILEGFLASVLGDELFLPYEAILNVNVLPLFVYHEIRHLNWGMRRSLQLSPSKRGVIFEPARGRHLKFKNKMKAYQAGFSMEELRTFLSDLKLLKGQYAQRAPEKFLITKEEREGHVADTDHILGGFISFSESVLNGLRLALEGSPQNFIKVIKDEDEADFKIALYRKSFGRVRLVTYLYLDEDVFVSPRTPEGRLILAEWVQEALVELDEIKKEKARLSN